MWRSRYPPRGLSCAPVKRARVTQRLESVSGVMRIRQKLRVWWRATCRRDVSRLLAQHHGMGEDAIINGSPRAIILLA
jgi:hypothetical protein